MDLLRRGLKLSHVRLIAALKETGQMSAAATQLSISQPAASRLAAELETILGVTLYARHPRGVSLTRYGEHLAARARTLLRGLHDAGREITELCQGLRGSVSIGAVTGPAVELVIPVIGELRATHPQLSIGVAVDTSIVLADALMAGTLDFYLGRVPDDRSSASFRTSIIGDEPIDLIVRPNHPLTRRKNLKLSDAIAYEWVLHEEGSLLRRAVEAYLLRHSVPLPDRVLRTSSTLLTLVAVSQADAVAPISRSVAQFVSSEGGLRGNIETLDLAPDLTVSSYYLISRDDEMLSPSASTVFDMIEKHVRQSKAAKPGSRC